MSYVLFADSAFWIALAWPKDDYHGRARAWHRRVMDESRRLVTTDAVLFETLNNLAVPPARSAAVRVFRSVHADPRVAVISTSDRLIQQGFDLFAARSDKSWSLVDCISFVVMKTREIDDALTSDRHFEQAGFNALLRSTTRNS